MLTLDLISTHTNDKLRKISYNKINIYRKWVNNLGYHIKSLVVNDNLSSDYKLNVINNLSKVNIFVGSNNSGKSRFLRGLFAIDGSLSLYLQKK